MEAAEILYCDFGQHDPALTSTVARSAGDGTLFGAGDLGGVFGEDADNLALRIKKYMCILSFSAFLGITGVYFLNLYCCLKEINIV